MSKSNKKIVDQSAFAEKGLQDTIHHLCEEIRSLYLCDEIPWVVGYSGGKDSSAVLQLVWLALADIPIENRKKPVHVISTDTLVEQPVVSRWVDASHDQIRIASKDQNLPIYPHKLTPEIKDTFWVNLIGKGYPAPRNKFRWCTDRMKISPSNKFIREVVRKSGEAILVLGTRKAESQKRAVTMEKHASRRVRERLTPNASLPNSLVYTPIEDWSNDDVWMFLMQVRNPWGFSNKSLLTMYQGASADGECPLVVDTSTPSCGSSRFGCWVCTLVDKDRSMEAMIKNDDEKVWMTPLLEVRNDLGDFDKDRERRDFRRMNGSVQLYNGRPIPGPYKKKWREEWLRRVLTAQRTAKEMAPVEAKDLQLITMDELNEIRRIWLYEKHEFDDSLPQIYEEVLGLPFPTTTTDDTQLRREDWNLLEDLCDDDPVFFELQVALLDIERQYRGMTRRAGIYDALLSQLRTGQYSNEAEAMAIRSEQERRRTDANSVSVPESSIITQSVLFNLDENMDEMD